MRVIYNDEKFKTHVISNVRQIEKINKNEHIDNEPEKFRIVITQPKSFNIDLSLAHKYCEDKTEELKILLERYILSKDNQKIYLFVVDWLLGRNNVSYFLHVKYIKVDIFKPKQIKKNIN